VNILENGNGFTYKYFGACSPSSFSSSFLNFFFPIASHTSLHKQLTNLFTFMMWCIHIVHAKKMIGNMNTNSFFDIVIITIQFQCKSCVHFCGLPFKLTIVFLGCILSWCHINCIHVSY
jgi:hypothetical protein